MGRLELDPQRRPEVPHLVMRPHPEGEEPENRGRRGRQADQALGATQADPPAYELDRHHQGQQHSDGPGQGAGEPEHAGQGEVGPPCRAVPGARAGRRPQGQETPDREAQQGRLGVAHDEDVGRRAEAEQPDGAAGHQRIARLAADQREEQDGGHEGRHVGHDQQGRTIVHSGQPAHGVGQGGDGGKEAERLLAEGVVAHPGDRLVVPGVPPEQALVHPGTRPGSRTRPGRVEPIDGEVGQPQRPDHHRPRHQEGEHGLGHRLAQPRDRARHDPITTSAGRTR